MPHQNLPESWVDTVLGAIATACVVAASWFVRLVWGLNGRVTALERGQAVADERHEANLQRLDSIDARSERIERKLDRLSERL